ncbi:carbamoyl transferase, partial [bacterium]|nr:carbamoyl transferase [bacterium]
ARAKKEMIDQIPGAIHINGTSRLHTVNSDDGLYYKLLLHMKNTRGLPMVINTSFNDNKEPIVLVPLDAYNCFFNTNIDCLVMGNYFVCKN